MEGVKLFSLMGKLAIDGVDESKQSLEEVSQKGEDTKKKLNVSFKEIGTKVGEMGVSMAKGLVAFGTGVVATVEATREMREDFGKLETAFQTTGSSTETANKVFKELYGTLGENDRSIEAANHLAMLTNNEKDLSTWTDICTGIYATFGDSLPIEGLTEAANETAKTGQLTGVLADALNWAGISEDSFQEKLDKCNTEAEREKLIRETLNNTYKEASDTYKNINGDVIANNKSQADLNKQLADATAKIEPLITKGKEFLVNVLEKAQPLIDWVVNNFDVIAPIILGIAAALSVFSVTMGIVNAVMMASPVTWIVLAIVAAIAALVAIIVVVVKHWDQIKEATSNAINKMKEVVSEGVEKIKGFFEKIINFVKENWQSLLLLLVNPIAGAFKLLYDNCEGFRNFVDKFINTIVNFFKNNWKNLLLLLVNPIAGAFKLLYDNCDGFREFIDKWIKKIKDFFVNGFNSIKDKVVSTFTNMKNSAVNIATNLKDGIVNKFNSLKNSVTSVFNQVKTAITSPIEKARDVVKGVVDRIKGFFNFSVSLPNIKLPHFSITPSGWKIGDLLKGSIPKLGISWYAKAMNNPMLLQDPTAFGFSSSGNIRVGGEAGDEIVGGANTIMGMIRNAVSSNNGGVEDKLDRLISLLTNYLPAINKQQVVLSTGELVGALCDPMDKALAEKSGDRRRGR